MQGTEYFYSQDLGPEVEDILAVMTKQTSVHISKPQDQEGTTGASAPTLHCLWKLTPSPESHPFYFIHPEKQVFWRLSAETALPSYGKYFLFPNHENRWLWLLISKKNNTPKTLSKKELILQPTSVSSSFNIKNIFLKYFLSLLLTRLFHLSQTPSDITALLTFISEFKCIFGACPVLGESYCNISNIN